MQTSPIARDSGRDVHEEQVLWLVRFHGPADALEPARAAVMATEVLIHSIAKCNNRKAMTGVADDYLRSPFLRRLAPMIAPVLEDTVQGNDLAAAAIGHLIADLWFARRGGTEYLDTSDITGLVGTAYGVALGIVVTIDKARYHQIVLSAPYRTRWG